VAAVLDALSAPAGSEDDRTHEQRYHDALAEAMRWLCFCIVMFLTSTDGRGTLATDRSRVGRACTAPLPDCQAAKRAGTRAPPLTRAAPPDHIANPSVHNRRCAGSIGTQTSLMALKVPQRHSHPGDLEVGSGAVAAMIGRDHAADCGRPFGGDHVPGPSSRPAWRTVVSLR
jgi:hypothetical protein